MTTTSHPWVYRRPQGADHRFGGREASDLIRNRVQTVQRQMADDVRMEQLTYGSHIDGVLYASASAR